MGPLAIAGIGAGLNLFNRLLGRQNQSGMVDPSQFKQMLLPNILSMRSQAMNNITDANLGNVNAIKQMGAARGLPAGAINSMLQGQTYQTGRAAASVEPEIQQRQADAYTNYLGLMNRFKTGQEEARRGNAMDFGADIGGLTKIMLMQKMKMFDLSGEDALKSETIDDVFKKAGY